MRHEESGPDGDEKFAAIEASSSSAASEVADRLPDDACADEPGDELDNLAGASSVCCNG
jgi:hypothetical protein